jgi:hypothetical protein
VYCGSTTYLDENRGARGSSGSNATMNNTHGGAASEAMPNSDSDASHFLKNDRCNFCNHVATGHVILYPTDCGGQFGSGYLEVVAKSYEGWV